MALFEEFHDERVGQAYVDLVLEFGDEEAGEILQRSVNRVIGGLEIGLRVNGVIDTANLEILNQLDPESLLPEINIYTAQFKRDLEFKAKRHDNH